MQFLDSIRARALRLRAEMEEEDTVDQLSRPIPEAKHRDVDMVVRIHAEHFTCISFLQAVTLFVTTDPPFWLVLQHMGMLLNR